MRSGSAPEHKPEDVDRSRRTWLASAGIAALLVVAGLGLCIWINKLFAAPRPALPLPAGFSLVKVDGNCPRMDPPGHCEVGEQPRSYLTIRFTGAPDTAFGRLSNHARSNGWRRVNGLTCADGEGCVGLVRVSGSDRMVLSWFATNHTRCLTGRERRADPHVAAPADSVDCGTR